MCCVGVPCLCVVLCCCLSVGAAPLHSLADAVQCSAVDSTCLTHNHRKHSNATSHPIRNKYLCRVCEPFFYPTPPPPLLLMPPKRALASSAAAAQPIDTSIQAINKIQKKLKEITPILYKKDQHADASNVRKQLHELSAQIRSIYDGQTHAERQTHSTTLPVSFFERNSSHIFMEHGVCCCCRCCFCLRSSKLVCR